MTDFEELRAEIAAAVRIGLVNVSVDALKVAALLVDYDAVRAAVPKIKAKKSDYPPEFVEFMGALVRVGLKWRGGTTLPKAFMTWNARMKAGATPTKILAAADEYARFCKATNREVMMAQTFLGPGEYFTADWTIPKATGRKGQMHGSIGEQDFTAGIQADGSF